MSDLSTTAGKLDDLALRLEQAQKPVGQEVIDATHEAGRLTARERVLATVDEGSFVEVDALAKHRVERFGMDANTPLTDGVVAGYATVEGRKVCIFAQDSTIFDGQMGEVYGEKIVKVFQLAAKTGVPLIGFYEGTGARPAEGVAALHFYSTIMTESAQASGVIPQVAVVTGAAVGAHAILPSLADILIMVKGEAHLNVTPAETIATVSGEDVAGQDFDALTHTRASGVAHAAVESDKEAAELVRNVVSFLPSNNRAEAPRTATALVTEPDAASLDAIIPDSARQTYEMTDVISRVVDGGQLLQLQEHYAANVITGFARIEGRSVGVVANQPSVLAGCLDVPGTRKAARFIRMCDTLNIPIVTFVDAPGFLPNPSEEYGGVSRTAAQLAYAYAEASVGLITVITRKAMGAAYTVFGAKGLGADLVFAWPTAEIAATDAATAVPVLYQQEIAKAQRRGKDVEALVADFAEAYEEEFLTPYMAAERGIVDAVIPPAQTRAQVVEGLRLLDRKVIYGPAKKHGNIQL